MAYFRFSLSPTFAAHLFKAIVKQHHREDLAAVRPFVQPDSVIIDVGGHAGQYAKLFARLVPAGRVFTFEPASYARLILRLAIALNRFRNVVIVPAGLGSEAGCAVLAIPVKRKGALGFGLSHIGEDTSGRPVVKEAVPMMTLDGFVAAVGLERVDFIKADIEGWEQRMLVGGEATLRRFRPTLLLEMMDVQLARAGDTLDGCWRYLQALGYAPAVPDRAGRMTPLDAPRDGDIWWVHSSRSR